MAGFRTRTYELKTRKRKAGSRLTFALLADLHNKEYGPDNTRLIEAIRKQQPDAILIAGDMLIGHTKMPFFPAQKLVLALQKIAPVYYANGNHESRMRVQTGIYGEKYKKYMEPLREAGVCILINDSALLDVPGGRIWIHGFEMDLAYYQKFQQPFFKTEDLTEALGKPEEGAYHILLAHNPVYFSSYADWGADLTLSGHLHGGVVRLPFLGGVITPQVKLFPKYDKGLFKRGERALIVSPGLGTHTINIRIFNPAELMIIRLEGKA